MNYFISFFLPFFSSLILSSCIQVNPFGPPEKAGVKYYISNDGHDENPGTIDEPWRSISKVNAINFIRGDSILFKGGHLFKGSIRMNEQDSASAEYPVIISSYGKGRAVIDGGDSVGLYASDCDHLGVSNLVIRGSGRKSSNTSDGIYLEHCDSITLDQLEVYGFQHSGIQIHKSTGARITYVYAHDNGFAGTHVNAVDAGLDMKKQFSLAPGNRDLAGNRIPSGPAFDIGAIEYINQKN
jgi:hypothetical protein